MRRTQFVYLPVLLMSIAGPGSPYEQCHAAEMSTKAFDQLMHEVSNRGRWGANDERGTLNLITPAEVTRAAASIRQGISISLERMIDKKKSSINYAPFEQSLSTSEFRRMTMVDDIYVMRYHGWAYSHLDGLAHLAYDGKLYNDHSREILKPTGADQLGVENMRNGIVGRGVLIDVPRLKGLPYLEPGTAVTVDDIEAWEKRTGIRVKSGDILLIRVGRWARQEALGPWDIIHHVAGPQASISIWLKKRRVAALGSDAGNDVIPSGVEGLPIPLHLLTLVSMGMPLFDHLDLEALANEAERQKRWVFLFCVGPLAVPGGSGSPVNPIAVF